MDVGRECVFVFVFVFHLLFVLVFVHSSPFFNFHTFSLNPETALLYLYLSGDIHDEWTLAENVAEPDYRMRMARHWDEWISRKDYS